MPPYWAWPSRVHHHPFCFFLSPDARLQREEEEAYASSQQTHGAQSLTFTKFEEKKTNEKSRKVTTVKKFFGASSRAGAKKGKKGAPALNMGWGHKKDLTPWSGLLEPLAHSLSGHFGICHCSVTNDSLSFTLMIYIPL